MPSCHVIILFNVVWCQQLVLWLMMSFYFGKDMLAILDAIGHMHSAQLAQVEHMFHHAMK